MNKFWYNFNNTIFKASLVISIILALIQSIVISALLSNVVGGWALLIWILILGIGILIILELHSLWGLIIEYVGTVNGMSEDIESLKENSGKSEVIAKENEKDYEEARFLKATSTWECLYCHRVNPDNKTECLNCNRPKPTATWECSYCNSVNPDNEKRCLNCNRPKPISTWKCIKCNSVNPDTADECRVCKRPRWTKEPEKWVCTHCSNVNSGNENYCGVCGSHRGNAQAQPMPSVSAPPKAAAVTSPAPAPKPQPAPQKWTCSSCGNVNNPNANFCSICGNHR